jgi:hypothetical protein
VEKKLELVWLEPPELEVPVSIGCVLSAKSIEEHKALVRQWAELTFDRWYSKHGNEIEKMAALSEK